MARTSRSVAQRLAAQSKSKKRRPRGPITANAPTADETVEEAISASPTKLPASSARPSSPVPAAASTARANPLSRRPAGSLSRSAFSRSTARTLAPRKRYSEYTEEYAYVAADLRRIVLVASILIVLLVGLSYILIEMGIY